MNSEIDVRDVVGSIDVPTLVLHRTGDRGIPVEGGRWLASRIPGARMVEFDGIDHVVHVSSEEIVEVIRGFLADLPDDGSARV